MTHVYEQKKELRAAILERIQRMNKQARDAASRSIVRRLLEVLPQNLALCAFFPLPTEPDIRPLLSAVIARGQPLYLPACAPAKASTGGSNHLLVMRRVSDLTLLRPGSCNIPEPPDDAGALDAAIPAVVLIPGRAFDLEGGRLGRGNGGYDRWIGMHRAVNTQSAYYGVAFECQMVNAVPVEAHDAALDGIVTERGLEGIEK